MYEEHIETIRHWGSPRIHSVRVIELLVTDPEQLHLLIRRAGLRHERDRREGDLVFGGSLGKKTSGEESVPFLATVKVGTSGTVRSCRIVRSFILFRDKGHEGCFFFSFVFKRLIGIDNIVHRIDRCVLKNNAALLLHALDGRPFLFYLGPSLCNERLFLFGQLNRYLLNNALFGRLCFHLLLYQDFCSRYLRKVQENDISHTGFDGELFLEDID
jgi:hypothetical protein